ncbi:hypothetical protein SLA2020_383730 [Shorea laevis]
MFNSKSVITTLPRIKIVCLQIFYTSSTGFRHGSLTPSRRLKSLFRRRFNLGFPSTAMSNSKRKSSSGKTECSVYVGNLDERVTDRVLYDILIQAGRILDLHIPRDRDTGKA